jgi:hypothetical protein
MMNKVWKILVLWGLISLPAFSQQKSEAFIVTVKNMSIHVISPFTKGQTVSVVIKNETMVKLTSELRSRTKVLKRFTLKPLSSKSILVNTKGLKQLYYVSVAPPFQAVELKFNEKPYEIPEKE